MCHEKWFGSTCHNLLFRFSVINGTALVKIKFLHVFWKFLIWSPTVPVLRVDETTLRFCFADPEWKQKQMQLECLTSQEVNVTNSRCVDYSRSFYFFRLPHCFDSVPLSIAKGSIDSNVSSATAKVITTTIWKHTVISGDFCLFVLVLPLNSCLARLGP